MPRFVLRVAFMVAGLLAIAAIAKAQDSQPVPQSSATTSVALDESAPVPVPEPTEKAIRHHRGGNVLWAASFLWSMLVPILLLTTGASAKIRDIAARIGKKWFFTIAIYAILISLITFALDLPLAFYSDYVRPHAYDLSNQTLGKWLKDVGIGLGIGLVMAPLILWIPYLLLKKSPKRWWLYTGLAVVPLIILLLFISPVFIDPLFNKFGPMKDKGLEQKILALAERSGIEGGRVYEVEKSVDTKTVNAYVNGFANTKRIVLWDTIIKKLSERELLFVMGHEMGHFVLGHVRQIIVIACLLVIFGLWVVHRTAQALITKYGQRWRFTELSDVASYPLIIVLFSLTTFALTPALLAFTRHNEAEADRFGIEITRDNRAAAMAFVKLQEENLAVPRPSMLYKLWRSTHPPIGERIDFFNAYKPWTTGEPLRYEKHFVKKTAGE